MKIKKSYLVVVLLLVIGLGALVAYKMYNKPHVSVKDTKAVFSLNASKIISDFSSDEDNANAKYLEKIIEVKGTIKEVKTENGKMILTLGSTEDMESVMCHMINSKEDEFKNLKIGDSIAVKGICTGYLLDVILVKCVIIK